MRRQCQRLAATAPQRPVKPAVPSELAGRPQGKQRRPGAASSPLTPGCGAGGCPCSRLPPSRLAPGRGKRGTGGRGGTTEGPGTDGEKLSTCGDGRGLPARPPPPGGPLGLSPGRAGPPAPLGGGSAAGRRGVREQNESPPSLPGQCWVPLASRVRSVLLNLCVSVNLLAASFVFTGFKAFQAPLGEDGAERLPRGVSRVLGGSCFLKRCC